MKSLSFHEVVENRHSCRRFLPEIVPEKTIKKVLEEAQRTPSNCNTQPWVVHIVSGKKQKELSQNLIAAHNDENFSLDFTFDTNLFEGRYKERQLEQGKAYYESLGIKREDKLGRENANLKNLTFYNSPHVALLFMPSVGDNIRVASDIGMYAQTFLLSLTANGLAGVPQTILGFYADTIRKQLGISNEYKMLFGISFGFKDEQAMENKIRMKRSDISENVIFHK